MQNDKSLLKLLKSYGITTSITGTSNIQSATKGNLSFVTGPQYAGFLKPNLLAVIFVPKGFDVKNAPEGNTYVQTPDPRCAFAEIHNAYHNEFKSLTIGNSKPTVGKGCTVDSTARFGENVSLGNNVTIFPFVSIGNGSRVGDGTVIRPSVTIYNNVHIGRNCVIDSGATIGGEGFSTSLSLDGKALNITNIGGVRLGDFVQVGNNSTIDRATFSDTVLEDRVKVDNLVHIAHNVQIGEDTRIAALSCIAGSTIVGKRVWIGIGCTIRDNVTIGDDSQVLMNAVLIQSIGKGERVGGFYAMPHEKWKKHVEKIRESKE